MLYFVKSSLLENMLILTLTSAVLVKTDWQFFIPKTTDTLSDLFEYIIGSVFFDSQCKVVLCALQLSVLDSAGIVFRCWTMRSILSLMGNMSESCLLKIVQATSRTGSTTGPLVYTVNRTILFSIITRLFLVNFYTFCTSRNRKEYSTIYLFNGMMTSLLHHIARQKV